MRARRPADAPIRVLQSFPAIRATTNPYLTQLYEGLAGSTPTQLFSWGRALRGDYDVFHVHWPEVLLRGSSPVKTLARRVLFLLVLVRVRLGRRRVLARTAHNVTPHEGGSRLERALLALADRWTGLWIVLVPHTELPAGSSGPVVLIPHGHYIDHLAALRPPGDAPPAARGRLLFFGLIRRYKGIEELLAAFEQTAAAEQTGEPGLRLRIVGKPADDELRELLRKAAAADPRVDVRLEYVPDGELADEIARAELVVLPYRHLHNSGVALLALSLDRPILVPSTTTTELLREEAGDGWVFTYASDCGLDGRTLMAALEAVRDRPSRHPAPDLSARDWAPAIEEHLAAYRRALDVTRGRSA